MKIISKEFITALIITIVLSIFAKTAFNESPSFMENMIFYLCFRIFLNQD